MRVARIAVRASQRTAHVRVHRPETHAGDLPALHDLPRDRAEIPDVLLLTHDGERAPHDVRLEQRVLPEPTNHLEPARENRELTLPKKYRKCKTGTPVPFAGPRSPSARDPEIGSPVRSR